MPNPEDSDEAFLVAYVVGSEQEGMLTVRLMPENLPDTVDPGPIVQRIRQEIDFFLSREKDPMKYLRYRATTVSNLYCQLQWAYKIFDPAR